MYIWMVLFYVVFFFFWINNSVLHLASFGGKRVCDSVYLPVFPIWAQHA